MFVLRLFLTLMTALVAASAGGAPAKGPLTVYAAASLTEVLPQVAARWKAPGRPDVAFNFDASSRLAKQVELGAPADVLITADDEWLDHLANKGRIALATRRRFLGNVLVLAVPAGSPRQAGEAKDFDFASLTRIALAGENVPAGRYGESALRALGVWPRLAKKVLRGDSVRSVLTWLALGEVEAGIVYGTDVRAADGRVRGVATFSAASHPPITYAAAVTLGRPLAAEAEAFLRFCAGEEAQRLFREAGFLPPPAAP